MSLGAATPTLLTYTAGSAASFRILSFVAKGQAPVKIDALDESEPWEKTPHTLGPLWQAPRHAELPRWTGWLGVQTDPGFPSNRHYSAACFAATSVNDRSGETALRHPIRAERRLWAEPNRKEWSLRAAIKHHFAAGLCPTKSRITQVCCCPTNRKPLAGVLVGHYVLGSPAYKLLTVVSAVPT